MGIYGAFKKLALALYTGITIAATAVVGPVALLALAVPATYHLAQAHKYYTKGDPSYGLFEGFKALGVLCCPWLYLVYQIGTFFLQPVIPDVDPKYRFV